MYRIVDVVEEAHNLEPMGSKPKFWFSHPEMGICLFKAARPGSGEDWSEKVAERLAAWLGLPHATYELASWRGDRGIVTPRITGPDERLVHGNELLVELNPRYGERSTEYRTPLHTVAAVFSALELHNVVPPKEWIPPEGPMRSIDVLAGYLLLDALIGNTDRHHENWAAVETLPIPSSAPVRYLAPTFDHASSLGRNEPLERVVRRLNTRDGGFTVEAYAARARSAFYRDEGDLYPLSPIDAFGTAISICGTGISMWCNKLATLSDEIVREILEDVPKDRMAPESVLFVTRMIAFNRHKILELCQRL
jgi:hypothetical protein